MDPTQRLDPNRTAMGVPPVPPIPGQATDPMRTTAIPAMSGNVTTAIQAMPGGMPGGKALTVDIVPGRTATMANGPARESFLLDLKAGGGASTMGGAGPRTAMNLCLVIDRSGSMEGPPLESVKQAVSHVVDLLSPQDTLSIVTFEETVELLMAPQRVTQKEPIKRGIAGLRAGNTTNFSGGIELALTQLGAKEGQRATRMIVFTDGEPTAGITEFSPLVSLAERVKSAGATMTLLGFGPDYNEELLAAMAKRSGGNYYFVRSPETIEEVFRAELQKVMTSVAREVTLSVKLSRWVQMRAPQQINEGTVTIPLADLERGAGLQQVLEFDFPNHPLGQYRVAAATLSYEDLTTGTTQTQELDLIMEFTADAARYGVASDPRVGRATEVAAASRAVEKTVMGLKTGVLNQVTAIQDLQKTQALLLSQGRADEARDVTMALRALQTGDAGTAEKTLLGTVLSLDQGKQ